jgi:predicted transposase YdaD
MLMTKYNREEEMEVVREEALEEGLEKGREDGIMTTARNALAKGSTPEFVHEITGLDMEVIKAISSE